MQGVQLIDLVLVMSEHFDASVGSGLGKVDETHLSAHAQHGQSTSYLVIIT